MIEDKQFEEKEINRLTREEAIASLHLDEPHKVLIELDKPPEKSGMILKPRTYMERQHLSGESGKILKMHEPEMWNKTSEEAEKECSKWANYKVGDRIIFFNYSSPQGVFEIFPEIRFVSLTDVIGRFDSDKPIVK